MPRRLTHRFRYFMSIDHYENFPVASILLPARLRPAVRAIYRYARNADDVADEGHADPHERLQALAAFRRGLEQIEQEAPNPGDDAGLSGIFVPLAQVVRDHALPLQPFHDLLSAFEQDVSKTRYRDDAELRDYCRRSANPVGRLMLHLYQSASDTHVAYSDAICTGLQLTNFWQDVAIDWAKNRVYIPQDALQRHAVPEDYIGLRVAGRRAGSSPDHAQAARWQALMQEQVGHARGLLRSGLPLGRRLPGRIGYELRMVVHGGLRILERLDQLHYDVFDHRPTLGKLDWLRLAWRALSTENHRS